MISYERGVAICCEEQLADILADEFIDTEYIQPNYLL